ncbi:DegT/DnrJ/EryC1/StrS family aminotransferase [Nonomuraea sp. NPDC049400]|uniref:DegT/DnrJ/EryC1/StrS family aminotransferase n=1 Tax=Nonomuraea sp. NPDC049400 TaxID=3364352 RepID=UPI003795389A
MSTVRRVPFYGMAREFDEIGHEILDASEAAYRTGSLLDGELVAQLEVTLASLSGRQHARMVNSCTDAIYFALVAAGVGSGDEVLVPDFSFAGTLAAVLRTGATPVFVDVCDNYLIDLELATEAVTPKTRALVFVQLYGRLEEPNPVESFVRRHDIALIVDGAQSFGAAIHGRHSGSIGIASCHSFDPMKVIAAPGSGGAVLTDDQEIAEHVEQLRRWGYSNETFVRVGFNSRMSSVVAAVLTAKLQHEERWLKRRRSIASTYSKHFSELPCEIPDAGEWREHIFHKYVIRTPRRDDLARGLSEVGIETIIHYPYVLHELPFMQQHHHRVVTRGVAKRLSQEVVSLPIHPYLTEQEIDHVVANVKKILLQPR